MKKVVFSSMRSGAGKTSIIIGLMKNLKDAYYVKPFGDRLKLIDKKLYDEDALSIGEIFGFSKDFFKGTIGFDHSKMKYLYDAEGVETKLQDTINSIAKKKKYVLIESPRNIRHGSYVNLDAITVTRSLNCGLVIIVEGDEHKLVDDIVFLKKYIHTSNIDFKGVIFNKVNDVKEFKEKYLKEINETKVPVLGIIPYEKELAYATVDYIKELINAKVVAGEAGMDNVVKHIFVGAMSADAAMRKPIFKLDNKMIITAGDRSDMILAAAESHSAAVVITNGILPPANILSIATHHKVPILLCKEDTFTIARKLEPLEPFVKGKDKEKISMLKNTIKKNVDIKKVFS